MARVPPLEPEAAPPAAREQLDLLVELLPCGRRRGLRFEWGDAGHRWSPGNGERNSGPSVLESREGGRRGERPAAGEQRRAGRGATVEHLEDRVEVRPLVRVAVPGGLTAEAGRGD